MVEPKKPLKRKDQIMIDEEFAKNLEAQKEAELEEEERLARIKEEETNIALIEAFFPMDTELEKGNDKTVEDSEKAEKGSSKRAGSNLEQEDVKRQRLKEENESAELKRCLEIILEDNDDVTIENTPLSSKSPTIVDYNIYKEGKKIYFKIIRAYVNTAYAHLVLLEYKRESPKPKYVRKKADSDTSPKQKPVQASKGTRLKTKAKVAKSDMKKQPVKKPKAKGLDVLSKVALIDAEQLKLVTKRSKKDFHISHASGLGDGVDTHSKVLDDDDMDDFEDDADNDDDSSEDHDDKSDDEKTKSDRDEIPYPNLTNVDQTKHKEEDIKERVHTPSDYKLTDDEKIHDEENVNEKEEDEVTKELYDDVNVNLGNEDTKMTNADQGASEQQNASHQSRFEKEEEDAHVTLAPVLDTQKTREITSLMDTIAYHATAIPEITSSFTTPTPPLPLFFNPLSQQATPTPTPMASETTTSLPALPNFSYYVKVLSFIPAIVDRYMDNKLGEAINKVIQAHNFDYKKEAKAEKKEYIKLVDLTVRSIIKEEVNAQLPQILPQAISDVSTPIIEKNVTESLEDAVLTRGVEMKETKIEAPPLDQNEGRKEENQVKMLSHPKIQGQRKRSLQEFVMGDNDEQPADKEVTKANWFKKAKRSLTPDPDWNKTAYTSYSDPHGIIYVDRFKRKRLMRADELYKFSDGTLNDVRTALHDIAAGIRIKYPPMRKWSNLDKKMA
uniref:Uncharacterized protein n=1 Tax=Tanacetum cinerariifolium TaxID=118510 RepID=A0A6L2MRX8_TANCI|nr:hypothetical protein [Tanacetum cinerariifolium]